MNRKTIRIMQIGSLSVIWILFTGIAVWIINLIRVSFRLKDAPNASIGISIVAIPIFFILAAVLTYVFVGLSKATEGKESDLPGKNDQ